MEVILLEKIGKLGNLGDKVTVKAGYGRNFLIPQGHAVPANAANLEKFEARRAELEAAAIGKLMSAQSRASELEDTEITIVSKAGDEGKLFGSIGTRDIADAFVDAGFEIAKAEVRLPEGALRNVGEYDLTLQLHPEVSTVIKVTVVSE